LSASDLQALLDQFGLELEARWLTDNPIDIEWTGVRGRITEWESFPPWWWPGVKHRLCYWGELDIPAKLSGELHCCARASNAGLQMSMAWKGHANADILITQPLRADIYPALYAIPFTKIPKLIKLGYTGIRVGAGVRNLLRLGKKLDDIESKSAKLFCIASLLGVDNVDLEVTLPERQYDDFLNLLDW